MAAPSGAGAAFGAGAFTAAGSARPGTATEPGGRLRGGGGPDGRSPLLGNGAGARRRERASRTGAGVTR